MTHPPHGDESVFAPDAHLAHDVPPVDAGRLPIAFTASGSEYFRIWIVNLLLTFVTLGVYHPWAKVRKLRYFYGNTWVGEHSFDFHGNPRAMLRGTLLVGAMLIVYSAAGHFSATAGFVALLVVAAIWPALFRSSMRFRMANTSWRGMRFQFNGNTRDAYAAMLPAALPVIVLVGLGAIAEGDGSGSADSTFRGMEFIGVMATLVVLGLVPWVMWRVKRYQHGHYALGAVQSRLRAGPGAFYSLFAKTVGVSLLASLVALVVPMAVVFGVGLLSGAGGRSGWAAVGLTMPIVLIVGYLVFFSVVNSFMASRLQNLVWNATSSSEIRFDSQLLLKPMLLLTLKNWALIGLTLGFYWPFAAIATARLRLQSVTVLTRESLDQLAGRAGVTASDATGDAAGDLFGLDVGL